MKLLYDFLTIVIAFLLYPFLRIHSRGKRRLSERYGNWKNVANEEVYWFHGASIGEVKGLLPLIRVLRSHQPQARILLTATSPTGLDAASDEVDAAFLMPFDHLLFLKKPLSKLRVRAFIFGETELWPNILSLLTNKGVPLHLVNGVISDKSFYWYRKLRTLFMTALGHVQTLSISDQKSFSRFLELGAVKERMQVTGNAKHDRVLKITSKDTATELKKQFFLEGGRVLTLGSMHPGEIEYWFPVLKEALVTYDQLSILIAPRHREKFSYFHDELMRYGFSFTSRSKMLQGEGACLPVCLLDTYGELEDAYSFSNAAFVGGTFVDIGGHNPFEPASYGVLPVVGPYVHKISPLVKELADEDACIELPDISGVRKFLKAFMEDEQKIQDAGERARRVFQKHQGAAERIYKQIVSN